jgi:hypothetical protein
MLVLDFLHGDHVVAKRPGNLGLLDQVGYLLSPRLLL